MKEVKNQSGHCQLLFKHKHGPVQCEVWGPRIGWTWRRVELYRWQLSSKEPGKWEKLNSFQANDLLGLEKCIKALRSWQAQDEK